MLLLLFFFPSKSRKFCASLEFMYIIIIMVIFKCYISRVPMVLSYKKWCEHRIRKNEQIKSTAHDEESCLE